jgi:hypothetical protein
MIFVPLLAQVKVLNRPSVSLFLPYKTQSHYHAYGYNNDDQQHNYGIITDAREQTLNKSSG